MDALTTGVSILSEKKKRDAPNYSTTEVQQWIFNTYVGERSYL